MKRIVSSIAAVAGGLWLTSAGALGLGEIDVRSHLNQRFDAVIPLTSVGADEAADLRAGLASAEDFAHAGLERTDYLSSLHFAVRSDGAPRIEISSDKLEREPFLQLLLEVRGGGSRILRQYTVLLDPAGMASSAPVAAPLPIAPSAPAPSPLPAQDGAAESPQSIFVEVDHPKPPPDERPVAPRSEPVKPAVKAQSTAPAVTTPAAPVTATTAAAAPPVSGELYGPVKTGETLWSIATRVRGDNAALSMDQVLLSLYNGNPRAFDGGINGLNRGAMLSIPAVADMQALDLADAHREVMRLRGLPQTPAAATPHARKPVIEPAQITPPPPPAATAAEAVHAAPAAPAAATEPPDAGSSASAPAPSENSTTDGPSTSDSASSSAATPADAGPANAGETTAAGGAAAATTADAGSSDAAPAASDNLDATVPQVPVPPVEPAPTVKPAKSEGLLQALLIPLILGLLLLFVIAWLFARWRARRAAPVVVHAPSAEPRPRMPLSTPSASEAAIAGAAAAAAAAATQKLTPQEELDRLQASIANRTQDVDTQQLKTQQVDPDATATSETAAPAADLPPVDFDLTGQFATQTVQIDLDANDPVSEADFHLAYGLYDEAALLLRQAAEKDPQRVDIGVKLAETYFAAGKTAEFSQTAAELKPKLSAAEWHKLAIMGQQLDPTSEQFSDAEAATPAAPTEFDPAFDIDSDATSLEAAAAEDNAVDFKFDSTSPVVVPANADAAPLNLQADNGLDFKLDDLELPSLDVDKHDAPAPTTTAADDNALDFDLGGFDAAPVTPAAAEPAVVSADRAEKDESTTLDFDLGEFDAAAPVDEPASAADAVPAPATGETPIEEFDFGSVSTETGDLAADEAATKLDLARAYVEMGDNEMARSLLDEVLEQGNAQQKQDAQSLVERLA